MTITINISSNTPVSADLLDTTSLENLSLQYQSNFDRFAANEAEETLTQLSQSQIAFASGPFSYVLAGSGIGPHSNEQALLDAIDSGIATGAFNSFTLREGSTTILSMAFTPTATTLTSGDVSLRIDGNVPSSFEDLYKLQGLFADFSQISLSERNAVFDDLSAFGATGISLTQGGTQLFGINLTGSTASLTVDGYTFTAHGTIPQDLGQVTEALYQLSEASANGLRDLDLKFFSSTGQNVGLNIYGTFGNQRFFLDNYNLTTGQYYVQVSGYQGSQGRYALEVEKAFANTSSNLIEGVDASAWINTAYNIGSEGTFNGEIGGADTQDWIAFTYTQGQGQSLSVNPGAPDLSAVTALGLTHFTLTNPGGVEIMRATSDGSLLADLLSGSNSSIYTVDGARFDDISLPFKTTTSDLGEQLSTTRPGATFLNGFGGNDTMYSYDGQDVLQGGDGNDVLYSMDGNSTLMGGNGNDVLYSRENSDRLEGGDGADTLYGGGGDDFLYGGSSNNDLRDVIFGGAGHDVIDGGYGNDSLRGDGGNDTITGGWGVDTIVGGEGNDILTGQVYSDLIFGQEGDDFINGGFGSDRVNGGSGADQFYHLGINDHGSDWIQDFSTAEGDRLVFGNANALLSNFVISRATTPTAGDDNVQEVFITYIPAGRVVWALVDGDLNTEINIQIGQQVFDLLA